MTTLAFDQAPNFRESLRVGEGLLEKAGKLLARINSAIVKAAYNKSLETEISFQFDKVVCSVNDQLEKAEKGSLVAITELKELNSFLTHEIDNVETHAYHNMSSIEPCCSALITATALLLTQIRSVKTNLKTSQIDRACVGECYKILDRLEKNCFDICALLEDIVMNAQIYDALWEAPLTKSSIPELDSVLG